LNSSVTGQKFFSLPVTISGVFSNQPVYIPGSVFYPQGFSANGLLALSSLNSGIPSFDNSNNDGTERRIIDIIAAATAGTGSTGSGQNLSIFGNHSAITATELSVNTGTTPQNKQPSPLAVATHPFPQIALPPSIDLSVVTAGAAVSSLNVTKDPAATWLTVSLNEVTTPASATLTFDPTVTPANYSTTLTFSAPGFANPVEIPVNYTGSSAPWFTKWGFASAASYVNNVMAPGEAFIIFGYNFGRSTFTGPETGANGGLTTTLANTQVLFDNSPAPLYYVENPAGNAFLTGFAPFALAGKTTTQVQIVSNGVASPAVTVPVVDAVPALFTGNGSGSGQAVILNADGSVNSDANPASANDVVTAFGGGGGQTTPPGVDGAITGSEAVAAAPKLNLPVKIFLDGAQVTDVPFAGPASGYIEGVFEVQFRIPATVRHNANLPLMVQIGDKLSQSGVTVAVQ